jgi:hypothetical protein
MGEELRQVGVVQFVVDDETGVDGDGGALIVDIDRGRVAANALFLLINGDLV